MQIGEISVQMMWTTEGVQLIGNVPAKLTREETATMLGFHRDAMTPLANKKLLMPLGAKGKKKRFKSTFYATVDVVQFMNNSDKMAQAQFEITKWNKDNQARSKAKHG